MIFAILKFVHIISGVIAISAGSWMLFGVLAEKFNRKWAVVFLDSALVASATGLLFPFSHFHSTQWAAMSAVYVVGVAVLAWRRCGLAGIWALIFALISMLALYLEIFVVIVHIFEMLIPPQPKLLFFITESMAMLFFVGLGIFTVKKFRASQAGATVRPMVHGCN